jgi:3-phosphoshikimate 1-carboxyvinyltransferase
MVKDFSQAAWEILVGVLAKQGRVTLQAVSVRPEKTTLLKYLILMNVALQMDNHRWLGNEPVADFIISPPKKLFPVRVHEQDLPALLETLPILLRAAACADGTSLIPYTPESDPTIQELISLGADITLETGMLKIVGQLDLKNKLGQAHA